MRRFAAEPFSSSLYLDPKWAVNQTNIMNKKTLKKYLVGDFTLKRVLRSILFIYAFLFILTLFSDKLIFQPQKPGYKDNSEIIKIEMIDGPPISAMYFENPKAEFTVLYSHGNAVDIGNLYGFFTMYRDLGFSVLAYDYCGYGTSPGKPTAENACLAADAALKYLVEKRGLNLNEIIIHGRSVGGGPALYLARKNKVAGLIVESSFVSAFRVLTRIPILPFDKFKNINLIDKVNCPVLVIHGKKDRTISFWHGEKLFEKAKEPKMCCWLEDTTHNHIPEEAGMKYLSAISDFTNLIHSSQINTNQVKIKALRINGG